MKRSLFLISILTLSFAACKSLPPLTNPGPSISPPVSNSEVNTPLTVPKSTLTRVINSQVPQTLIKEQGMSFGNGIEGDLQIIRNGAITWAALDSQLIEVKIPIKIQGEVGLKKSGLGSLLRTRIPLDETLEPLVVMDPEVNPDWSVGIRAFELIELGGALDLDVLGMSVDLSGVLSQQIRKWADENLVAKKSVIQLKPVIDLAWEQVGKPFQVEVEGFQTAFSIQPQEVRFREFFDADQSLNVWLGLAGKVNSHPATATPSRAFPLPSLSPNSFEENALEILMPFSISYAELDELLAENLQNKVFRIDKKTTMIPSNIHTQAYGELIAIRLDFFAEQSNGKSLEGNIFAVGKPYYDPETRDIRFREINFKLESGNFGAQTTAGLKKRKIIRNIQKRAVFPLGDLIDESLISIEDRLGLSTPIGDLKIENLVIEPAGFYPLAQELLIQLKANGTIGIEFK